MAVIQKQSTARPVKTQLTESGVAKKPLATIARPINAQLTESGVAKKELLTEAQVVQNLTESSLYRGISGALITGNEVKFRNAEQALRANPHWVERYKGKGLVEALQSGNGKEAYTADYTLVQMANIAQRANVDKRQFMQPNSGHYRMMEALQDMRLDTGMGLTESVNTTTSNILSPAQAIVDMVGIFTPQSVIHHLCDPISVPRMTDIVYRLMPKFSETAAGVTAGETLFQKPTDGTYASVYRNTLVPADGTQTSFTITLQPGPATPNTVVVVATIGGVQYVATDNGRGSIVSQVGNQISGTIVYEVPGNQSTMNLTFLTAPDNLTNISTDWNYDYEADDFNNTLIRSIYIEVDNVNIRAVAHPLRVTVSSQAEFELKSLADYSMITASQEAALGLISNERDIRYINTLRKMALTDAGLNFDAAESVYYPVSGKFSTFETVVNYARFLIQTYMGRGTVTTIVGGAALAGVVAYCPSFKAAAAEAPIGPYLYGTLQDGSVRVIVAPYMPTTEFVIYFKGYGPGDNPVLYASWLDLYVTPDITMYDLNTYQALASFYDIQVNEFVVGYVWRGYITNYMV